MVESTRQATQPGAGIQPGRLFAAAKRGAPSARSPQSKTSRAYCLRRGWRNHAQGGGGRAFGKLALVHFLAINDDIGRRRDPEPDLVAAEADDGDDDVGANPQ